MIECKLDELIWKNKTTAEKIAKELRISENTISRLRNNKNSQVSLITLSKLCKYFNCRLEDLMVYVPD